MCSFTLAHGAQLALFVGAAVADVELDVKAGLVRFVCNFPLAWGVQLAPLSEWL